MVIRGGPLRVSGARLGWVATAARGNDTSPLLIATSSSCDASLGSLSSSSASACSSRPNCRKAADWSLKRGRVLSDRRQAGAAGIFDRLEYGLHWLLLYRNLQKHLGLDRSRVRLCAGAAVSPETIRFFDIIGIPVSQGYGLTECGGVGFVQTPKAMRIGAAGVPLEGTEWKLLPDGEIALRSPGVFKGYFLDDSASKSTVDEEGWLHSGDIVELLDNGEIAVVDRKKAIIITSGGKNIAPSEIENSL
jgi:long-chain acyl-CoA synthetase